MADPMRIWIVNHHADPPDGLATRSFDIARRFVEKGNPTTIFVCAFSHYHLRPVRKLGFRLWRSEDIEGVRMVWIAAPSYRGNDWRRVLNMVTFSVLALLSGALRRERPDHTLQPTALAHEALLRLLSPEALARTRDRAHFLAAAATAMRQVLVESLLLAVLGGGGVASARG